MHATHSWHQTKRSPSRLIKQLAELLCTFHLGLVFSVIIVLGELKTIIPFIESYCDIALLAINCPTPILRSTRSSTELRFYATSLFWMVRCVGERGKKISIKMHLYCRHFLLGYALIWRCIFRPFVLLRILKTIFFYRLVPSVWPQLKAIFHDASVAKKYVFCLTAPIDWYVETNHIFL